jgi:hypothetical protein
LAPRQQAPTRRRQTDIVVKKLNNCQLKKAARQKPEKELLNTAQAASKDAKTASTEANIKPSLRPIRAIIIDAGAVAHAVPTIINAMGKVAKLAFGAI